ncbi:MAG: radical SAM protein [Anaeromyxobacter sp.]
MRVSFVQPCIGRRPGERYLRSWQMEPLQLAVLAALTPRDVEVVLHDDRMEEIPYDAPTDLVAISVETYTARRAYQIASAYRRRGVPVVMGGFHAMLQPEEVARYADSAVVGEAELLWPRVVDDWRHGRGERVYRAASRPALRGVRPDRTLYRGRRYLPIGLVESGRGCPYHCEFCAVQSAYGQSRTARPVDEVVADVAAAWAERPLVFLVDDNVTADLAGSRELLDGLATVRAPWISQCSIHAALDEDLVARMARSGCQGVLVGLETTDPEVLRAMGKTFNGGDRVARALANLRRHRIAVYGTFVAGYEQDGPDAFAPSLALAKESGMFLAAFAHLTPFPGTPLHDRLAREGRLLFDRWWLDPAYRFGQVAYRPVRMSPEALRSACLDARRDFYSWRSTAARLLAPGNRATLRRAAGYLFANVMHHDEIALRDGHPLGDASASPELVEAA